MDIVIRAARPADAGAICGIWNPLIRNTSVTFDAQEKDKADVHMLIRDRTAAGFGFFVVEFETIVKGFASYAQFRGGIGYAKTMEHTIILANDVGRIGIGRRLLEQIENHASAAGAHQMVAGISSENTGAQAFHQARGYQVVGVVPQAGYKFGRYMDLILMHKFLT